MKPMYGVTHQPTGEPIVVEPKATKVGIGLPKGKAIHAWMDQKRRWCVLVGKDVSRFEARNEAMTFYRQAKISGPDRQYPSKVNYFLFHRISADGSFEPDWDAIEAHGPIPTEISIVFTSDDPLDAGYQYWTATERQCMGDGLNADRILSLAATDAEQKLAAAAAQKGERTFRIENGCWLRGCRFAKPTMRDGKEFPAPCRARARLVFQLLASPRLGGTAYFDTTGLRSISQLFSCLQIFRTLSGRGDPARGFVAGIPLLLVLRPYRTSHNGQASTQYGVSLEFRAESAVDLKRKLIEAGRQFQAEFSDPGPLDPLDAGAGEPEDPPAIVDPEDPWGDMAAIAAGGDPGASAPAPEVVPAVTAFVGPLPAARRAGGGAPPPMPSAPPLDLNPKWTAFYKLCRARGMTDVMILEELGRRGCERSTEVPNSAYPELMRWAEAYRPGQRNLL